MKTYIVASLFILLSTLASAAPQSVGTVILSFGQNSAVSTQGNERELKRKSDIYADDLLKTGGKGRLQIRFTDGARLSLKPDTEFKIAEYQFDESQPKEGKALYQLLKGGMRTISGQIGKVDKEAYKLDAVVATIGIRGTDFTVEKQGDQVSGAVNNGKINVSAKEGGSRDIVKGRSFQLTGASGTIRVFKTPTSTSNSSSESDSAENEAEESDSEEENSNQETSSEASAEENANGSEVSIEAAVTTSNDSSTGTVPATTVGSDGTQTIVLASPDPTGNGESAPTGSVVAIAFTELDPQQGSKAASGRVEVNGQSAITVDSTMGTGDLVTGLVYIDQNSSSQDPCSPCTMSGPSSVGVVIDQSNKTLGSAQVTWGRWGAGYTVVENGVQTVTTGSFHFMYTDSLTPNSVITNKTGDYVYRYDYMNGAYTSPQNETGATGTLNDFVGGGGTGGHVYSGTYFRVDFDTQNLLEVGIEANIAGASYALREDSGTNMSLSNVLDGGDVKLIGTCSGGACGAVAPTDLSGHMTIDFVGTGAEGAITSYGASGTNALTSAESTITGTILLEATPSP